MKNSAKQFQLKSDRLKYKVFEATDCDHLFDLDSDPAVMNFINGGTPSTREQVNAATARILKSMSENPGMGNWILLTKDTNEFVGWVMLRPLPQYNEIELGYRLKKKFWGRGFATEASRAVIEYGFSELKLEKIFAITEPSHINSQNVLAKLGMIFKGPRSYNSVLAPSDAPHILVNYYELYPPSRSSK